MHWHCYRGKMDGPTYGADALRRDLSSPVPPLVIRDWLRKPVKPSFVSSDPKAVLEWLSTQWAELQAGARPAVPPSLERAKDDLFAGSDVCWGWWTVGAGSYVSIAAVGTSERCH